MKKLMQTVTVALVSFIAISQASARDNVLDIKTWLTKNGVSVYYVERDQLPMVDIAVLFDAGSRRDDAKPGLANLTANLINQGTKQFSADEIANGFEDVGAEYGASVGQDSASFHLRTLTEDSALKQSIKYFQSVLTTPSFPAEQLSRLMKNSKTSLKLRQQSASTKAEDLFFQNLYPEGPYQFPVVGTAASMDNIKLKDIQKFYLEHYVTGSAKIIIVGDVSDFNARALAERLSENLVRGIAPKPLVKKLRQPSPAKIRESFPGPQTAIIMGQLGIDRDDPHYYAITLGNAILGGLPFYSRLFDEVREKQGLTYHVESDFSPLKQKGPFSVMLQTQNANADHAIKVTQETIQKFLVKGPTQTELNLAKKNIRGKFPMAFASNMGILHQVALLALYDLPITYFDEYRDHISEVTQMQIQQAFNKLLHQEQWLLVRVGNA